METENRRHTRAKVKWPVSIKAPTGIIDGTTENLSLSGAFIRLSKQLNSSAEIPLVLARIFHELLSRDHVIGNPLVVDATCRRYRLRCGAGLSGAQRVGGSQIEAMRLALFQRKCKQHIAPRRNPDVADLLQGKTLARNWA